MHTMKAERAAPLLEYLVEKSGFARTRLKKILTKSGIRVNGKIITRHDYPLAKNDRITLGPGDAPSRVSEKLPFPILHEDKELLVIDKPAGLLTIATDTIKDDTAYFYLTAYVRSKSPDARVFIVHRLDRETSGLLVFTKTEPAKRRLQENWEETSKTYLAVVEGRSPKEGTVESLLAENKFHRVYSTRDPKTGKPARTRYVTIKSTGDYSLVEIYPDTGRKNQIRVHMSDIGHPIIGDEKYNAQTNPVRRLGLHASSLSITHPVTRKRLEFKSPLPQELARLFVK